MRIGFALIPEKKIQGKITEVTNGLCRQGIFYTKFGTHYNLPHITLFQSDFDNDFNYKSVVNQLVEQNIQTKIKFERIMYMDYGWYFYEVKKEDWLYSLHENLLKLVENDIKLINIHKRLKDGNMSKQQKESIEKYNYRYAGDDYIPHLTLGRYDNGYNFNLMLYLDNNLAKLIKEAGISKITAYEVGPNGSHKRTLYEVEL